MGYRIKLKSYESQFETEYDHWLILSSRVSKKKVNLELAWQWCWNPDSKSPWWPRNSRKQVSWIYVRQLEVCTHIPQFLKEAKRQRRNLFWTMRMFLDRRNCLIPRSINPVQPGKPKRRKLKVLEQSQWKKDWTKFQEILSLAYKTAMRTLFW